MRPPLLLCLLPAACLNPTTAESSTPPRIPAAPLPAPAIPCYPGSQA
jgi:hypothetical protein